MDRSDCAPGRHYPTMRAYDGKSAFERRSERRERLLEAGLELFGTRGYAATTIEMLCTEAHMNARYFYQEYRTREALLKAVYDRHVEAVFKSVRVALLWKHLEPEALMRKILSAFISETLADPRAARINYFEMVGVSPELERERRTVLGRYALLAAEQIERVTPADRLGDIDIHMLSVAFVSATDGLVIDALTGPGPADQDAIVDTLAKLFLPMLG